MNSKSKLSRKREIQEILIDIHPGLLIAFCLVLGLPFVGLGGFFIYRGVTDALQQAALNTKAIEIPALILSSKLIRPVGAVRDSSSFYADIEFSYEYEGVKRQSKRIWPVEETGKEAEIQAVVERFPVGTKIIAFVDPIKPEFAFLEKRWSLMVYVSISIGCIPVSFVTMLATLLTGWRGPQLSQIVAAAFSVAIASMILMAALHVWSNVPSEFQAVWLWTILTATFILSFCPLLTLEKTRQLNKIYQEAQVQ